MLKNEFLPRSTHKVQCLTDDQTVVTQARKWITWCFPWARWLSSHWFSVGCNFIEYKSWEHQESPAIWYMDNMTLGENARGTKLEEQSKISKECFLSYPRMSTSNCLSSKTTHLKTKDLGRSLPPSPWTALWCPAQTCHLKEKLVLTSLSICASLSVQSNTGGSNTAQPCIIPLPH